MTLSVKYINPDYFKTNRHEEHPCYICRETPKDALGRRWVAHENPYSTLSPILTRSLFSQYVHPMHDDCYAQLKGSSNNCPECRAVICKEGEVLKDHVYEDDGYWSDDDIAVYEDDGYLSDAADSVDDESGIEADSVHEDPTIIFVSDEYLSDADSIDDESVIEPDSVNYDESEIEAYSVHEDPTIVFVSDEYLSADSVNDDESEVDDDESEIESDSVEEATAVYVDDANNTVYHTLLAEQGLYSLEPM